MANENNDVCEIVKKCKILLLDIEGTTTSISFVKDKLFPYAEQNVKEFLEQQWECEEVKEAVAALRKLALEDHENKVEGVIDIPGEDTGKEEQIEGLVKSVKWQMSADRKVGPLKQLQGLIWKLGYDKGDIKGHVYDDVLPALEQWRSVEGQQVYIYSSGSVQAQKLLFGQSVAGDLLPHIAGHFDTAVGAKQEPASYKVIAEKIGCKPEEILFLTDIVKEAEAARSSGLQAVLVSRAGNSPLPPEASSFPVLHSLAQLVSNKRKQTQAEEVPAKVPKTDIEDDVKTSSESVKPAAESKSTEPQATVEASDATPTPEEKAPEKTEEPEKMEVEEVSTEKPEVQTDKAAETTEKPTVVETIVEEITDAKEAPEEAVEMEPVVLEDAEKTETIETEKMEAETVEVKNDETVADAPKEPEKLIEDTVAEETPPAITVEEINDKEALDEVAEIIEDLEPVVEEPPAVEDMEELQNVGEVLEKECDEILSKVQDVTNLDNIPIKPLLNTIAEETMETENADSNDIVDRILDTEIEMGMKPCEDIDPSTVQEITDSKTDTEKETKEKESEPETNNTEKEEKATEKTESNEKSEEKKESNEKSEESKESKVEAVTNGDAKQKPTEAAEKPETVAKVSDESKTKEDAKTETEPKDSLTEPETKEEKSTAESVEKEVTKEEKQVNGKTTNGDAVNQNGVKDEELSSRLAVENGKEVVNGANGGEVGPEGQRASEVADIKVKSVVEERTDPIEQPTEA